MTIDINASPIAFDFEISGSMPNINIDASSIDFGMAIQAVFSSYPAADRNPDLDQTFDCLEADRFGDLNQGVLDFDVEISGSWLNVTIFSESIDFAASISGSYISGSLLDQDSIDFGMSISGDFILEMPKQSWVKWSDIGNLNFTIGHDNVAGERPMEWTGPVYDISKLNDGVIVYGANGVASMKPSKNSWGYKTIHPIGTKGKNAQVGTENIHWFIDTVGNLYELTDKITYVGYSEFFASMSGIVLSLNEKDKVVYICDGTIGYTYSYEDRSLGKSAGNVTGYGYKNGTSYVVSPATITNPTIEFTTNTYDMGTRKEKTIFNFEVSTNVDQTMQAAIQYKVSNAASWATTPWTNFTQRGIAYMPCYGIEFRFKFKMETWADFSIDQFKINGVIHGFSFLDTVRKES